ncbi:MAG: adenylyltransferase/cytidyltransferase family protein [Candidatus Yanofskybacteria bacterium]|nr:adenylyltransferase/cytidyltransferase family protein [Candidatus Yanofskybacteria bacterium]
MKRAVVFGTFDGVHEGHQSFFAQAREHGDELIALIAPDSVVARLKGKLPRHSAEERIRMAEKFVDRALLGDESLSSYRVLAEIQPHVICLGYDQEDLEKDLREAGIKIPLIRLKAHAPERFHTSLLS